METLTYVSTAVELFSKEDLEHLLRESRARNSQHGITGLLLYNDGTFMQTIEGSTADVRQLYENICADTTHYGIIKLVHQDISERVFPDWSMGFMNGPKDLDGYNDYFDVDAKKLSSASSYGEILLSTFRSGSRTHKS